MRETVLWFLACVLTCTASGLARETDSVPAAITVYRNPDFFGNLTRRREEEVENSEEEEDKEELNNNSEEFHDFDDYKYPGEPRRPNPPAEPDFTTYYDESPEFVPEPRDVKPSGAYADEDEGNELNEEEEKEPVSSYKYHVPPKLYEESRQYYNPVFKADIKSFSYPSSFKDLDYYSHPPKERKYTDNKKGTREYLKDHSVEEVEEPKTGNVHADSKHVFRTISKFGIKPIFYVPYAVPKIKAKYKFIYKPKKLKWRMVREVPDDSAYQLSSDYDSDFELF